MLKLSMSLSNSEAGANDFTELTDHKEVYYDLGETEMLVIGQFINNFMRAVGYNFNKEYIYMESLTEDELEYLDFCLNEYRSRGEEESE